MLARGATRDHHKPTRQLADDGIRNLITGNLRDVIHDADLVKRTKVDELMIIQT